MNETRIIDYLHNYVQCTLSLSSATRGGHRHLSALPPTISRSHVKMCPKMTYNEFCGAFPPVVHIDRVRPRAIKPTPALRSPGGALLLHSLDTSWGRREHCCSPVDKVCRRVSAASSSMARSIYAKLSTCFPLAGSRAQQQHPSVEKN